MAEEKRRYLSRADEFNLAKFMEPLFEKNGNSTVRYVDDWTDAKVAAKCGIPVSVKQIEKFRLAVFGKLPPNPKGGTFMERVYARIESLEARVAALELANQPKAQNRPVYEKTEWR